MNLTAPLSGLARSCLVFCNSTILQTNTPLVTLAELRKLGMMAELGRDPIRYSLSVENNFLNPLFCLRNTVTLHHGLNFRSTDEVTVCVLRSKRSHRNEKPSHHNQRRALPRHN